MDLCVTRLLSGREADSRLGIKKTKRHERIHCGTMPPPIKRGPRVARYVSDEIDAVVSAEISGASDDQIRALVQKLIDARKLRASALIPEGLG
jgi:predicted DNA-binding transcriptional regulator AlpA